MALRSLVRWTGTQSLAELSAQNAIGQPQVACPWTATSLLKGVPCLLIAQAWLAICLSGEMSRRHGFNILAPL